MSPLEAAGLAAVAALLCGLAGLGVPVVIARLPEPMGPLAARPGVLRRSVLGCAVVGAVLAVSIGPDPALLVALPLVPHGVLLATVDRHTHLIPTRIVWPMLGLAAGLVLLVGVATGDGDAVLRAAVGGAAAFALFHLLWWLHSAGMGYGDVRLSSIVGTALGFLGWRELVVGVYAGFALFALVALGRAALRRDRAVLREPAPYGPALLGGAVLGVVLAGPVWAHLAGG